MSGNMCRCAAYPNIVDAIREVAGPTGRPISPHRPEGGSRRMKTFTYAKADNAETAVRDAHARGAKFIAGGTNLLDLMKLQVETPDKLVDISRLDSARSRSARTAG